MKTLTVFFFAMLFCFGMAFGQEEIHGKHYKNGGTVVKKAVFNERGAVKPMDANESDGGKVMVRPVNIKKSAERTTANPRQPLAGTSAANDKLVRVKVNNVNLQARKFDPAKFSKR